MTAPIPDDLRAKITAAYATGLSARVVAAKYGVGIASVYRIADPAKKRGGRKISAHILDAAVQDYLNSGDSARSVARRHPISEDTLRLELTAREVTRPSGATTPTRTRQAAMEDYVSGMSIASIATKHSIARSTVSAWVKADGLTGSGRDGESPATWPKHGWVRDGLVWRPIGKRHGSSVMSVASRQTWDNRRTTKAAPGARCANSEQWSQGLTDADRSAS